MAILNYVLNMSLCFFVPLLIVALGGMYAEKSGVLNIALEGIMIFGAFCGTMFLHFMEGTMPGQLLFICAILVSMVSGAAFSMLHAYASITLKADQTISATAINTLAPAVAVFVAGTVIGQRQVYYENAFKITIPGLCKIPIIGPMLFENAYLTTYLGIAILLVTIYIFSKTKFGLRLSACGENPQAADSLGIDVYKTRYTAMIISGMLGGLGGLAYIVPIVNNFQGNVYGYGFLAMSVITLGQWKPSRIFVAAFFFAIMKTLASAYMSIPFLVATGLPDTFYKCLPYAITLFVLAVTPQNATGPKAAGEPYDKGKR